jgi:hypothetical protein
LGAPPLSLRIARVVTGLAVVLSLSIPLHGPGHGLVPGHGMTSGHGVERAVALEGALALEGADRGSHPGGGHQHGPGGHGEESSSSAVQAPGPEDAPEAPLPLCLCCPGPCACAPALALRAAGERCLAPPPAASNALTGRMVQAPVLGPVPYERPWPTAPPPLRG